ncbi:unnamed protein product, partial [Brachionus calyciflorus]
MSKKKRLEQKRNTLEHKEKRKNTIYKKQEQTRNTIENLNHRQNDPIWRAQEQEKNTQMHRDHRQNDPIWRAQEQEKNTQMHRDHRKNDLQWKALEQEKNTQLHREHQRHNRYSTLISVYEKGILEGPILVCVCCGGTFFKRTVQKLTIDKLSEIYNKVLNVEIVSETGDFMICLTCNKYITKIKPQVPQLALSNGLHFPEVDQRLSRLNDLEERLCSPRVAFIRIKDLQQWDKQNKMCGNVVYVPIDTQRTLEKLPRNFNQSETIQIKFKRKLGFEQDYKYERVQNCESVNFIVENEVINERINQENNSGKSFTTFNDISINLSDEDDDESNNIGAETLIVNCHEQTSIIAPGEGIAPRSIASDKDAEELTFLKIYNGDQFRPSVNLKFGMRC